MAANMNNFANSKNQNYNDMVCQAMLSHAMAAWNCETQRNLFFHIVLYYIHIKFQLSTVEAMLFVHINENEGKKTRTKLEQNRTNQGLE